MPCFWGDRKRLESSVHGGQRTVKHRGTLPLERRRPKGGGRQERKGHAAWLQRRTENPRGVWREQVQVR